MRIDSGYPTPTELKKNELKTLEFLHTREYIVREFRELAVTASEFYHSRKDPKRLENLPFNFETGLDILFRESFLHIHVGVNISPRAILSSAKNVRYQHEMVSYCLSICDMNNSQLKLLRKFHFDYAIASRPGPTFHMQYGGKLTPYLANLELTNNHMVPRLSEPRIDYHPVTLALLLNLVFCEFENEEIFKISQRNEWRTLIKKNEDLVLKPYYEKCSEFIGSNQNSLKLFTRDFCYGN